MMARKPDLPLPMLLPKLILQIAALQICAGASAVWAWRATNNPGWIQVFFHGQGGLFLVAMSGLEVWVCVKCWQQFSEGDLMRPAWTLFSLSAACHMAGTMLSEVFGARSLLNPISWSAPASDITLKQFRALGLSMGGPLRFVLLAWGLAVVLRVYRESGLVSRLARSDWGLIGVLGVYTGVEAFGAAVALRSHEAFSIAETLNWINDPLLLVLLIEAALIHRAAQGMGWGLVNRCWGAFVAAILLTCAGDIIAWANAYVPLPWQVNALSWHIWFAAGAAFALGPAYQLHAVQRICWNVRTLVHRHTRQDSGTSDLNTGAA